MQGLHPLARFDAELLGEEVARVLVGGQGLGLPSAPVEGQHQQVPEPLPEREFGDQPDQLGHQPRVLPELQPDLGARLKRGGPLLVQAAAGGGEERAVQPGERRAAPPG